MMCDLERKWTNDEIGQSIDPPLHMSTIAKFRRKVLASSVTSLRPKSQQGKEVQEAGNRDIAYGDKVDSARADLLARIQKHSLRRERWISDAENQVLRDADGLPMAGPDGKVLTSLDHRALAAHDRNHQSAMELEGRLTGALLEQSNQANVQLAIYMPQMDASQPTPAAAAAPAGQIQVYDIGTTRS